MQKRFYLFTRDLHLYSGLFIREPLDTCSCRIVGHSYTAPIDPAAMDTGDWPETAFEDLWALPTAPPGPTLPR
jgi:hypothetical protein